jgi:hypothetical protein
LLCSSAARSDDAAVATADPILEGLGADGLRVRTPDQNGWSRALHFEAAWVVVLAGLLYAVSGLLNGHFLKNLFPSKTDLSWRTLSTAIVKHCAFRAAG